MSQMKHWWEVYQGDNEKRFFVGQHGQSGLIRSTNYTFRSTDALAKESGLSKAEIESIISKYHRNWPGMIVQHPKDPEKWAYWQNVEQEKTKGSVAKNDQADRIAKAKKTASKP